MVELRRIGGEKKHVVSACMWGLWQASEQRKQAEEEPGCESMAGEALLAGQGDSLGRRRSNSR